MIRFGAWSTLLAVLALQVLVFAALLVRAPVNRLANLYLAALLAVIAGMLTPYVLGYAGFYDAFPWLTAAPFAVPLAIGPLLHAHVRALVKGTALPWPHLAPPALQFLYQALLFPFPVPTKYWWDSAVHQPWIGPFLSLAVLCSMSAYAIASWRLLRDYEVWLLERRRDPRPAKRIRLAMALLGLLVAARALYDLFDAMVRPIDYFDLFAFYILLGIVGLLLGADGWRSARIGVPHIAGSDRSWANEGEKWIASLRAGQWWRDPDLDLAGLARRLGTNATHLSRALNEVHGGFAAVLGAIRAEAVAEALDAGDRCDLLDLAFDAGFGSKASFNRAFRARFGMSPTDYRAARQRLSA